MAFTIVLQTQKLISCEKPISEHVIQIGSSNSIPILQNPKKTVFLLFLMENKQHEVTDTDDHPNASHMEDWDIYTSDLKDNDSDPQFLDPGFLKAPASRTPPPGPPFSWTTMMRTLQKVSMMTRTGLSLATTHNTSTFPTMAVWGALVRVGEATKRDMRLPPPGYRKWAWLRLAPNPSLPSL